MLTFSFAKLDFVPEQNSKMPNRATAVSRQISLNFGVNFPSQKLRTYILPSSLPNDNTKISFILQDYC